MTAGRLPFDFEAAPELPGSDRLSKYGLGAIRRLVGRLWDLDVEGAENVPTQGPGIITPNHLSFCDSVFVPAVLPRRVWAIGKVEYMDDWKTKHLFPAMGMIPVDRRGGKAAVAALDAAAKVLDGGHLFMIYPEGTRSRSGDLHKGRTGAGRLAVRCNAPIIPVGHMGTLEIQPPGDVMMKPFKPLRIRIGEPIWPADHGELDDPRLHRTITDAVMFKIAELSGQTYQNVYAGGRKDSRNDAATRPLAPTQEVTGMPTMPPGRAANTGQHKNDHNDSIDLTTTTRTPTSPGAPTRPGALTRPGAPTRPNGAPSDLDLSAESDPT
jgi:1-acyl-sn-glycerol-3-phosphate acyltransferase